MWLLLMDESLPYAFPYNVVASFKSPDIDTLDPDVAGRLVLWWLDEYGYHRWYKAAGNTSSGGLTVCVLLERPSNPQFINTLVASMRARFDRPSAHEKDLPFLLNPAPPYRIPGSSRIELPAVVRTGSLAGFLRKVSKSSRWPYTDRIDAQGATVDIQGDSMWIRGFRGIQLNSRWFEILIGSYKMPLIAITT
jgi:hypothetical protein